MRNNDIVIIEDDEDLGQMIMIMLSAVGGNISHFTSASSFNDHLRKTTPQLIIMDMLLSGADGRTICSELKNRPETKGIKILLMSAHPDAKNSCIDAGADIFLQKPFDMKELRNEVRRLMETGNR